MASYLGVGSYQYANVVPADDDTGLMETTQHEVVQRLLCRK
jgi:hypothetical protein